MSRRNLKIAGITLLALILIAGGAFFFYYRSLRTTPQYSLALLIDAAKHDRRDEIAKLVDTDAVVDDFVQQVTDRAIDIYGRGLPPTVIQKAASLAGPILPAVKERARTVLPGAIRQRSQKFASVPFFAMVFAADRYLQIDVDGDVATVHSKLSDRPLDIKMKRNGERWQVVGVKDDQLATDIARSIGEDLIELAKTKTTDAIADRLGVGNLLNLVRQAENLVSQ
jgi:hypothetical protein